MVFAFDDNECSLPVTKHTDVAEIVGVRVVKGRKADNVNFQDQDEDESYSKLLFYAHFDEPSDCILNRVNNHKVSVPPAVQFLSLSDGDPLSFEDSYGRKLKSVYSATVTKGSLKDLFEGCAFDNSKHFAFEFWFWSKEPSAELLSTSNGSLALVVNRLCLSLTVDGVQVFQDSDNKSCKFSVGKWCHVLLQVSKGTQSELHFNGLLVAKFACDLELRQFRTDKPLFLPVFEGEVTEVRLWKSPLDDKRRLRPHTQSLPETFERKFGKNIMFKQDRLRNKSLKSQSLIAGDNKSIDSVSKTDAKRHLGLEAPKGSRMFISTTTDVQGHSPSDAMHKSSIAVLPKINLPGTDSARHNPLDVGKEGNRRFFPDGMNLDELMRQSDSPVQTLKSKVLVRPSDGSVFKGFFELTAAEEKELGENSLKDLLRSKSVNRFLRSFTLKLMYLMFNDQFKEGAQMANDYISDILANKLTDFYQVVRFLVFGKILLTCLETISGVFEQEAQLETVLKTVNLMSFLRLTQSIKSVIDARTLPLFLKASNFKMARSILGSLSEVSLPAPRVLLLHDQVRRGRPGLSKKGSWRNAKERRPQANWQAAVPEVPGANRIQRGRGVPQLQLQIRSFL